MTNQDNLIKALRLLEPTGFRFWQLAGNHNKQARRAILSALHGERVKATQCGITKMQHDFYHVVKPQGNCSARLETDFQLKAAQLLH